MPDVGERVLTAAREWIGTPVVWEASVKGVGVDCRGLVAGAARDAGLSVAREVEATIGGYARCINEAALLAGLDRLLDRVDEPKAGDVLAFRLCGKIQHLALQSHNGRMLHAYMGDPALVCEVPIGRFWGRRIAGVWRWRGDD